MNNFRNTFLRIKNLLPEYYRKKSIYILLILLIGSAVDLLGLGVFIPIVSMIVDSNFIESNPLIAKVYNSLGFSNERTFILFLTGFILFVIVVKNIVGTLILRVISSFSLNLNNDLSKAVLKNYYSKGFSFFKSYDSHEYLNDVMNIPTFFCQGIVLSSLKLLNELIIVILIVVGLLIYNPIMVLLLVCSIIPVYFVFYFLVKKRLAYINYELDMLSPKIFSNLYQLIYGYIDVNITNSKEFFFKKYDSRLKEKKRLGVKFEIFNSLSPRIVEFAMIFGILIIVLYGILFFDNRQELANLFGLFVIAAYRIMPSSNRILQSLIAIKGKIYTIGILENALKNPDSLTEKRSDRQVVFKQSIELKDITFSYKENENILNKLSLKIFKGSAIGIIGKSGSGKTTLINIILRFINEQYGKVLVDGGEIDAENLVSWRNLIGYVPQDVFLVKGSFIENIAFGVDSNNVDLEKVKRVISDCQLEELVSNLPNGINTNIGEGGNLLSGGQKQRIAIARALYRDAQFLIFDEATSALDNETENEITDSINTLKKAGLTVLVIAHRYSTLKYCDNIYEVAKGEITRELLYNELINK